MIGEKKKRPLSLKEKQILRIYKFTWGLKTGANQDDFEERLPRLEAKDAYGLAKKIKCVMEFWITHLKEKELKKI